MANKTVVTKHPESKKILVTREFDASLEKTWKAWTDASVLDKWWAPKPWKAETKVMDFREGGKWVYCMAGPGGEKHWSGADFVTINHLQNYTTNTYFCDENGSVLPGVPLSQWIVGFQENGTSTMVNIELTFETSEGMEMLVNMGFEGGFTMAHGNLDELLSA